MNSGWLARTGAAFRKEWRCELRSRSGLYISFLMTLLTAVACGFATRQESPSPTILAGLFTLGLVFSTASSVPRLFLVEDDLGTLGLLRLCPDLSAVAMGKLLFAWMQSGLATLVFLMLFLALTPVKEVRPVLLVAGGLASALGMAGGLSFCSAVAAGAANRWILSGALALPLLMPQLLLSILCLRGGFGAGFESGAWQAGLALLGFGFGSSGLCLALTPVIWGPSLPPKTRDNRSQS